MKLPNRAMRKIPCMATILVVAWLLLHGSAIPAAGGNGIDDESCLMCHDGMDKTLAQSPHRLASQVTKPATALACVRCHDGAAEHVDDPSAETIVNPADVFGHEAARICSPCHVAHVELDNYGFDAHSVQEMNCASCHKIHGTDSRLLLDGSARFCSECHQGQLTDMLGNTNHPVFAGEVTCLSCHRFVKRQDDDPAYQLRGVCRSCHPEQGGPFLYEHDAVNAYAVEGGGCTECHKPHASENDRLLKQPGAMMCRQCHSVPPKHINNTVHGDAWARFDCAVCHTAVHGSFDSDLFLDPNLPSRWGVNCYGTGCHSLNRWGTQ